MHSAILHLRKSQCRTPDAPEMRQCQTKSFLGNLVRFKTCNHDLRNSLKLPLGFSPRVDRECFRTADFPKVPLG